MMWPKRSLKIMLLLSSFFIILTCAPGPPPPPLFPGFEWLIIGLTIFLAIFLGKKYLSEKPIKTDYLTEALNTIHRQLKELEKKIDELEQRQNRGKNK